MEPSFELANEYMKKCKEEQKHNNFDKAIELSTLAAEIFNKLGSEWSEEKSTIGKVIITLENQKLAPENLFKKKKKELAYIQKSNETDYWVDPTEKGFDDYDGPYPFPIIPPHPPGGAGSAKPKVQVVAKGEESENELYCQYCGSRFKREQKFCEKCGAKLLGENTR